jgi:hypothetical protein
MNGNQIDLSSEPPRPGKNASGPGGADYLGVRFECCGAYARVYRNRAGDAYEGRCPKCLKPIRFEIGPGGTSSRFFTAS